MTKKKHPKDRAERIAREKKEHEKKIRPKSAKVRRQVIESLKERETEDELRELKST